MPCRESGCGIQFLREDNEVANNAKTMQDNIDARALTTYGDVTPHFRLLSAIDLAIELVTKGGAATGKKRENLYAMAAMYAEISATISWAIANKRS